MTVNKCFFVKSDFLKENERDFSALRDEEKTCISMMLLNVISVLCVVVYVSVMAFSQNDASSTEKKTLRDCAENQIVCLGVSR